MAQAGRRVGGRREWTPCRTPACVDRFTVEVGPGLVRWTAVAEAVAEQGPMVRLTRKGRALRLPLRRVGIQCKAMLARLVYIGVRVVRTNYFLTGSIAPLSVSKQFW